MVPKKTTKSTAKKLPLPNLPADWQACGPDCKCAKGEPCDGSCGPNCNCGGTNCAIPAPTAGTITIRDRLSEMAWAYWTGQMPLWGAFWVWGVFVGTLFAFFMMSWSLPLWRSLPSISAVAPQPQTWLMMYWMLLIHTCWASYYVWHVVSVWRCAAAEGQLTKWAARLFITVVTLTWWPLYALVVIGQARQGMSGMGGF